MKTNWKPGDKVAFVDFETMSTNNLEHGARRYFADESTRLACCVLSVDGVDHVWRQGEPVPQAYISAAKERTLCAHNADFDSLAWEKFVGEPATFFDTVRASRAKGLPGRLDELGKLLEGRGKDKTGSMLIDMISKVKIRNGVPQYFVGNDQVWNQFVEYCRRDVRLLEKVYSQVKDVDEPDVLDVDVKINDRGIPICKPLVQHLRNLYDYNMSVAGAEFDELTSSVNPRSHKQMTGWLEARGFKLTSISRPAMFELFQKPEEFYFGEPDECPDAFAGLQDILVLRNELVRTGGNKLAMMLALEEDGRVRDQHVYHRAHTGRWAGRQLQPQNFPIPLVHVDVPGLLSSVLDYDKLREAADKTTAKMRETNSAQSCTVGAVINCLTRGCVRGDLCIADYSAVEARGVAWLAREDRLLNTFADQDKDVYIEFATDLYGFKPNKDSWERVVSKQIVLGCGYGLSWAGFKRAFDRFMSSHSGDKLRRDFTMGEEESRALVKKYRDTFPNIPRLWKQFGDAAMACVRHGMSTHVGRCDFYREADNMVIRLPSGRRLYYRDVRIEDLTPKWAVAMGRVMTVPTVTFLHPHGQRRGTYGGSLCFGPETKILTDHGIKSIVSVTAQDRVWDGGSWVKTDGYVYNGEREIGTWLGVAVTEDHLIHDGMRWKSVIRLDADATLRCLRSAASSMPWSCRQSRLDSDTIITLSGARASVEKLLLSILAVCEKEKDEDTVQLAVQSDTENKNALSIYSNKQASRLISSMCGGIVHGQTSYDAAIMRLIKLGIVTVQGASKFIRNGQRVLKRLLCTSQQYQDSTICPYGSIGQTTTDTMNREMSVWSLRTKAQTTHVVQNTLSLGGNRYHWRCSFGKAVHGKRAQIHSSLTSKKAPLQNSLWSYMGISPVYDLLNCGPRHRYTVMTEYGPVIVHNCENAVQAICRDLMAHALVRFEAEGLNPCMHVHDEIVVESDQLHKMLSIMSEPPDWAPDFPLLVEGVRAPYWTKPVKQFECARALRGKVLEG